MNLQSSAIYAGLERVQMPGAVCCYGSWDVYQGSCRARFGDCVELNVVFVIEGGGEL
jgi:hypothetical protein